MASDVVPRELTSLPAIDTTSTQPYPTSPAQPSTASPTSVDVTSSVLATLLAPFANTAPAPPVEAPTMWTLLALPARIRAELVQPVAGRQPAGRSHPKRDRHRNPDAQQSVDRPGNHRRDGPNDKRGEPDRQRSGQRHRGAGHIYRYTIARVAGLHRGVPHSDFGHRLHGHLRCGRSDTDIAADSE